MEVLCQVVFVIVFSFVHSNRTSFRKTDSHSRPETPVDGEILAHQSTAAGKVEQKCLPHHCRLATANCVRWCFAQTASKKQNVKRRFSRHALTAEPEVIDDGIFPNLSDKGGEIHSGSGISAASQTSGRATNPSKTNLTKISANITVEYKRNKTTTELKGILKFRWPSDPARSVIVFWATLNCNYYGNLPRCEVPNRPFEVRYPLQNKSWEKLTLVKDNSYLLYNAEYTIQIRSPTYESTRSTFYTPRCDRPTKDFRYCPRVDPTTANRTDLSLQVSVTCIKLRSDGVSISLRWSISIDGQPMASNNGEWMSTVGVSSPTDGHIIPHKTPEQKFQLNLSLDHIYEIMITAQNGSLQVMYESLHLNTSSASLQAMQARIKPESDCDMSSIEANPVVVMPAKVMEHHSISHSPSLLVGIIAVTTLLAAAVVLVVVHKRCKTVRFGKTGLTKTNSYKSSPTGSLRLLRDGQLFSSNNDEWEIDAREVSLGIEIGQGAFGRVLTGHYHGRQVAIKVLKDNIPELYKDDLLREIALMKGIGAHPSIVSMLGACTVREPIALIMEYMPYGNLHSFLKKCRTNREVNSSGERIELTYCLLDELTGLKEFWKITSTDMISFARQVAQAMEYLSEKQYVHRDLAARNVLLGQDKVVKLCDFGLARLIYTGEQYFKRTNGRLPLKWMALESIKDRVFTTYSDVWSFGILLWEIVTMGASPYPNVALVDLYHRLAEGYRMQQPANCSDELYDIISQCWCENPTDRPNFSLIRCQLESLLSRDAQYLDLDGIVDGPPTEHSETSDQSSSAADKVISSTMLDII